MVYPWYLYHEHKFITLQYTYKSYYMNITFGMRVGEEEVEISGTVGVKQRDNIGPILFIYFVQAVSTSLDNKWNFTTPYFGRRDL